MVICGILITFNFILQSADLEYIFQANLYQNVGVATIQVEEKQCANRGFSNITRKIQATTFEKKNGTSLSQTSKLWKSY